MCELVALEVDFLRDGKAKLYLPTWIQKDYPVDGEHPPPATLGLPSDVQRLVSSHLATRWTDADRMFPSHLSDHMTTQAARNVMSRVSAAAGVRSYLADGLREESSDLSPHALRHGVACRMLNIKEGNTLYNVWNRLRHRSILTTERVYDHLLVRC